MTCANPTCRNVLRIALPKSQRYCSLECRRLTVKTKYRSLNPAPLPLSTGTRGTISELRVCVDLLQKGYVVYRAIEGTASCDLAVLKNGRLLRIEVTTGHRKPYGGVGTPKKDARKFDILAITLPETILYRPDLPSSFGYEISRDF